MARSLVLCRSLMSSLSLSSMGLDLVQFRGFHFACAPSRLPAYFPPFFLIFPALLKVQTWVMTNLCHPSGCFVLQLPWSWSQCGSDLVEIWRMMGKVSQLSYTYRVRPAELSSLTTLQELVLSYLWLASPVVAFLRNRRYPGIAS